MPFFLLSLLAFALTLVGGSPTPALEERQIPGLLLNIHVSNINAHFTGASLLNNQIQRLDFDISPILPGLSLITTVAISSVSLTTSSGTTDVFSVEKSFDPPIVVPLNGSINSGSINDVTLTQGSAATLGVVGNAALTANANFMTSVTIITNPLVLPLPVSTLDLNVPTTYTISLL